MTEQYCNDGDAITLEKYWLNSNLWGAHTGIGSQCLWATSTTQTHIAWGTSWDWSGQPHSIKSYNCAVLGWHWGWRLPQADLPLPLSAHRSIQCDWSFELQQTTPGGLNVSYDLWFSPDPHLGNVNASAEVMIWLYQSGDITPIGTKQTSVILEGATWDLWKGSLPQCGWPVYSFIRTTNTTSQHLDLTKFFDFLVPWGFDMANYLISVEAGPEIFTGAGKLETTSYTVSIR